MSDTTLWKRCRSSICGVGGTKTEVIRLIDEQGKLTDELKADILSPKCFSGGGSYKPYRQKRATRASKAKEKGLEPLAEIIRAMELTEGTPEEAAAPFICSDPGLIEAGKGAATAEEALSGAADIIAEMIADDADHTQRVRQKTFEAGQLVSEAADPDESTVYDMYYDYSEALSKIPNHRILAINRGEKEKKLKVRLKAPVDIIYDPLCTRSLQTKEVSSGIMEVTVEDATNGSWRPR